MKSSTNFKYQESVVKIKSYKLHETNRKRLFEHDESTDDEFEQVNKKLKLSKPTSRILQAYHGKEYEKCLEVIEEVLQQRSTQTNGSLMDQYKIVQATCWTMLEMNKDQIEPQLMNIIEEDPQSSSLGFAYFSLGLYQYYGGNMTKAFESFDKAVDLNPSRPMNKAREFKAKAKYFMDTLNDGKF